MAESIQIEGKSYERLRPGDKVVFLPTGERKVVEYVETAHSHTDLLFTEWVGAGDLSGWHDQVEFGSILVDDPEDPGSPCQQYISFEDTWGSAFYLRKDFKKV